MDWLKALIEKHTKDGGVNLEALLKEVEAELPKNAVPKAVYNTQTDDLKEAKRQLAERDQQLTDLQAKAAGHETLSAEISRLTAENKKIAEDYEGKIAARELDHAIDSALIGAGAKSAKAAKALLALDKIKLKDGELDGFADQLKALRKTDEYLFGNNALQGRESSRAGLTAPPPGQEDAAVSFAKALAKGQAAQTESTYFGGGKS
ncbi:MAG: phage scaffolding protein [Peptococcaceae bacterium]|jgi:myosin heavy subunit|nr:phage scaffolding protein [Peptococcaceae bacterium]